MKEENFWLVLQTVYLKHTPIFPAERPDPRYITLSVKWAWVKNPFFSLTQTCAENPL